MGDNYKFFQNKECEFFPCHKMDEEKLNCLFCFCPLYMLGDKCGGNFKYLDNGVKDCSECNITHQKDSGYAYVMTKWYEVSEKTKKE